MPRPPHPVAGQPATGQPATGAAGQPAGAAVERESDPVARVSAAAASLDGLDARPTSEHVAAFERVHAELTDALSAIDGV